MWSLKWFRSKNEVKLEELKVKEQEIKNEILEKQLEETPSQKPYTSVKLVKDTITVVLNSGDVVSKSQGTIDDFNKVRNCKTEQQVLDIIISKEVLKDYVENKEYDVKEVNSGFNILRSSADFEVKDNSVYLKGVKRSLPALLITEFARILSAGENVQTEEYQALKKFWLKCCLNPNARSAEDLYEFLRYHKFKIDRHGNFYAYRRVISVGGDNKELVKFIGNAYNKVKAVWKKKPSDYFVHEDDKGGYSFSKNEFSSTTDLGNLEKLYLNLPNLQENRYTDAHTRTMDYRVGEPASMPRNQGNDDNTVSCSKGLHIASKKYNYSGFGDVPVLAIINPIDVLAVPKGESGKLRTCRWFFAMTLAEDEQYILDEEDFDVTELGDIFEEKCAIDLEKYVQNSIAEEVQRHTFTLPAITGGDITNIVNVLNDMKKAISKRIVNG